MLNIDKIRHISFVKFLILFVAYMFFINYICSLLEFFAFCLCHFC
ncbi:hypothetical protein UNSW1_612 [Campylobacter concisus UNSW1]|nr:hypothetical protein UNSW1_612 [Campylobacter concisus UNSW1]